MGKTVTFSFSSTRFEGTEATETFTYKELGIDKDFDDEALKIEIDRIFQAWVWDKTSHLYHLKLNVEFYDKGIVKFKMRKFTLSDDDCFNFMGSYQPVIISEDGDVHFH